MFDEIVEHLKIASAGENVATVMTVFAPKAHDDLWGPRIWNDQILRYACYELEDGTVIGDRANAQLTTKCLELGWVPPEPRTPFDILPVILQPSSNEPPKLFEVPPECRVEVSIRHKDHPKLSQLGLKWSAIPTIASLRLNLGGIDYCCCPFNGW